MSLLVSRVLVVINWWKKGHTHENLTINFAWPYPWLANSLAWKLTLLFAMTSSHFAANQPLPRNGWNMSQRLTCTQPTKVCYYQHTTWVQAYAWLLHPLAEWVDFTEKSTTLFPVRGCCQGSTTLFATTFESWSRDGDIKPSSSSLTQGLWETGELTTHIQLCSQLRASC